MNSSSINVGDVIFQLINFGFLALAIIIVVSFFRSNKKRSNQLNRIEEKLNILTEEIKKFNKKMNHLLRLALLVLIKVTGALL